MIRWKDKYSSVEYKYIHLMICRVINMVCLTFSVPALILGRRVMMCCGILVSVNVISSGRRYSTNGAKAKAAGGKRKARPKASPNDTLHTKLYGDIEGGKERKRVSRACSTSLS